MLIGTETYRDHEIELHKIDPAKLAGGESCDFEYWCSVELNGKLVSFTGYFTFSYEAQREGRKFVDGYHRILDSKIVNRPMGNHSNHLLNIPESIAVLLLAALRKKYTHIGNRRIQFASDVPFQDRKVWQVYIATPIHIGIEKYAQIKAYCEGFVEAFY